MRDFYYFIKELTMSQNMLLKDIFTYIALSMTC